MKNKFIFISFLFVALNISAYASSSDEVQSWLKKMHRSAHMLNYEGTFVYGQNNQMSSMKIIHGVGSNGERERLISMDGTGREVIRDGKKVTCILPDKKSVVVEKSRPQGEFPPRFPMHVSSLQEHYELKLDGESRVAGKTAQKILILPRDNFRYGHAIWVEKQSGLLLKTHLLNEHNKPVEQFMFTDITFMDEVPDEKFKSSQSTESFKWYEAKSTTNSARSSEDDMKRWKVTNLPPGFKRDTMRNHHMPKGGMPVEHWVFSDGLASVSVFIEQSKLDSLDGASQMGGVNAHGRTLNDHTITVVGEVPQRTVKMIGESVIDTGN